MLSQCRTRTRSRLSEYEQPLPIHERDCGLSCQCDANSNVTGASARVCRGASTRRHEVMRRMQRRYQNTNNSYQSANITAGLSCWRMTPTATSRIRRHGCIGSGDTPTQGYALARRCHQITNNRYQITNVTPDA